MLLKRKTEREKSEFLRAGIIAAATCNVWRDKGSPPIDPWQFVPGERQETSGQTPEEQTLILKGFFNKK